MVCYVRVWKGIRACSHRCTGRRPGGSAVQHIGRMAAQAQGSRCRSELERSAHPASLVGSPAPHSHSVRTPLCRRPSAASSQLLPLPHPMPCESEAPSNPHPSTDMQLALRQRPKTRRQLPCHPSLRRIDLKVNGASRPAPPADRQLVPAWRPDAGCSMEGGG